MYTQRSLQLTPNALNQLQKLVQAHRTPQAIARRATRRCRCGLWDRCKDRRALDEIYKHALTYF
jgi:hypothetical protein